MASASTSLVKRLVSVPDGARNAIKFQPDLGGPPVEQGIGEGSFFFFTDLFDCSFMRGETHRQERAR